MEDTHWCKIKVKQIKEIIEGCARLNLEASSIDSSGALNSLIDVNFFIIYHKICWEGKFYLNLLQFSRLFQSLLNHQKFFFLYSSPEYSDLTSVKPNYFSTFWKVLVAGVLISAVAEKVEAAIHNKSIFFLIITKCCIYSTKFTISKNEKR